MCSAVCASSSQGHWSMSPTFNQSILLDIVLRQGVTYKSSTNLYFQRLCLVPTLLQPIYSSRHCAQTRRYPHVFSQSLLPDIVLRQDVTYESSTNLSFQTFYSDKTFFYKSSTNLSFQSEQNRMSKDRLRVNIKLRVSIPDKETKYRTSVQ